jgi:hypothetical protein
VVGRFGGGFRFILIISGEVNMIYTELLYYPDPHVYFAPLWFYYCVAFGTMLIDDEKGLNDSV